MISKDIYLKMMNKYGDVASWAVWAEEGLKPKSNMGDISIFDLQYNPTLLDALTNNVVMIALNFSRPLVPVKPFMNFHDSNPSANDFKIRFAFRGTPYWGAYMTDVIKNEVEVDSKQLKKILKENPELVQKNISSLRGELSDLGSARPIILAFGLKTYDLLKENLCETEYSYLVKLTHYSHFIGHENYKINVLSQIASALRNSKFSKTE